jgi:penicillin-binding protein 1A
MKADMMFDYSHIIDQTITPGAEGDNQGNGNANQYLDTSSPHVPVDSKLTPDEQRVLDEANGTKKKTEPLNSNPPQQEKKKKGFFKRLFGGK